MSEAAAAATTKADDLLDIILKAKDLSGVSDESRVAFYKIVCERVGLDPITRPFEFINLNGKLVLYAKRECTDQLRSLHKINITIPTREVIDGIYVVVARAAMPSGRHDESTGAVSLKFPKLHKKKDGTLIPHPKAGQDIDGEDKANAMMKAETKAKRRVTLSIVGLGLLDESEIDDIPTGEAQPTGAASLPKIEGPVAKDTQSTAGAAAPATVNAAAAETQQSPQSKEVVAPASTADAPAAPQQQAPAESAAKKPDGEAGAEKTETGELMPANRVKTLTAKMAAQGITEAQFVTKFGKPLKDLLMSQSAEVQAFINNQGK